MAYYKLTGGKHEDNKGVRYVNGDILKSSERLDQKYENKFVQATTDEVRAHKKKQIKEEQERARALEEEQELEATVTKQAAEDADEDEVEEEESELGTDATEEFEGAEEAGLKIFKSGRYYNVATAEDPDKAIRKGKELTKTQARAVVAKHAPQEEVEEEEDSSEDDS